MLSRFVFLVFLLVPAVAGATTYNCSFSIAGPVKVIPPNIVIQVAPDGQSATVLDGLIQGQNGGPIQARFFKDTTELMRTRWRLEDVISTGGQIATLDYSLVFRKARKRASITFSAHGYSNTNQATGTCAVQE